MTLMQLFRIFFIYTLVGIIILVSILLFKRFASINNSKNELFFRQFISLKSVLVIYIVVIFGATIFTRSSTFTAKYVNLALFSQYIYAWYNINTLELRNIILNILMFVPVGFLVPYCYANLSKIYKTMLLSLLMSFSIEFAQLITGRGIFALDDILNNVFGAFAGYGLFYSWKMKDIMGKLKYNKILIGLTPTILIIVFFIVMITMYKIQELGNINRSFVQNVDMRNVEIINLTYSTNRSMNYPIYTTLDSSHQFSRMNFFYYVDDLEKLVDLGIIQKLRNSEIITLYEAITEISKGRFGLNNPTQINVIKIKDYQVVHIIDTKLFFQPVYNFTVYIDGNKQNIIIPAL